MGKEDKLFFPNCKLDKEASSSGLNVYVCQPAGIVDGKMYQAREPIKVYSNGKHHSLENDGGLPQVLIERLMKWISSRS